jgi:regulator of protease activity HflC (stomatin/prohibitin superfamily)
MSDIIFALVAVFFGMIPVFGILAVLILASAIKIVNEYERGVKFTLGRFSEVMRPGLNFVWPVIQSWYRVDIRTSVIDVPKQEIMTKDNVSANINAVVYYRVSDAKKAIINVVNYRYAIAQVSQTTMREVVGETSLDELLSQRDKIAQRIKEITDRITDPWGIKVESAELKEIILPEDLIRVISGEAEAEREKRAIVLRAEGELESAKNMAKAAKELTKTRGGIHLRTLQTIASLSTEKSKTRIFAVPSELIQNLNIKISGDLKKLLE